MPDSNRRHAYTPTESGGVEHNFKQINTKSNIVICSRWWLVIVLGGGLDDTHHLDEQLLPWMQQHCFCSWPHFCFQLRTLSWSGYCHWKTKHTRRNNGIHVIFKDENLSDVREKCEILLFYIEKKTGFIHIASRHNKWTL